MTFYWRLKNIPELQDVPKKDRREWWREAVTRSRTNRSNWVFGLVMMISLVTVSELIRHMGGGEPIRIGGYLAVGVVLGLTREIHQQPRAREWLRLHIDDEKFGRACGG